MRVIDGGCDVLEAGQLAQRQGALLLDGGQRRLLGGRDAGAGLLAQAPGQAQDGQAGAGDQVVAIV